MSLQEEETPEVHTHREKGHAGAQRKGVICKPRKEASGKTTFLAP